jgi:hypothetical protein
MNKYGDVLLSWLPVHNFFAVDFKISWRRDGFAAFPATWTAVRQESGVETKRR